MSSLRIVGPRVTSPWGCDRASAEQRLDAAQRRLFRRRVGGQRITIDVEHHRDVLVVGRNGGRGEQSLFAEHAERFCGRFVVTRRVYKSSSETRHTSASSAGIAERSGVDARRSHRSTSARFPRLPRTGRARTTHSVEVQARPAISVAISRSLPESPDENRSRCRAAATSRRFPDLRSKTLNGPLPVVFVTARALFTTLIEHHALLGGHLAVGSPRNRSPRSWMFSIGSVCAEADERLRRAPRRRLERARATSVL